MALPPKARKLNIEDVPQEVSVWLKPIIWIITTFFSDVNSALDRGLTFNENFKSSTRTLTNVTNSKIANGLVVNTGITNPKNIFIDVIKSDGTKLNNVPVKWRDIGNGQIELLDITALRQTGTIEVQTNTSQAIELNSAHRNSIGTNPHKLTAGDIGITDYVKGWTESSTDIIFTDEAGNTITITKSGGDENVQSDWLETSVTSDSFIRNTTDVKAQINKSTADIVTLDTEVSDISVEYVKDVTKTGDSLIVRHQDDTTTTILTAAEIKTLYESNADTNAFTDVFKGLVEQVENGFLQSISFDSISNQVTITDNSGIVTEFGALPAPTLPNAGRILQQSADGTTWNLVSLAAATQSARELPCFAYAGAINNFLTRGLYAVSNVLPMSAWDPATFSFVEANLTATDSIVPCMTWNPTTQTYADNNIPLE